ncbi:xanthine dehydrogenase family protein subunit M [Saccharopolyspora sp. HNM0983]|uniref:Xanthine dehydrogenase family protein subunit M n=1 Tax=Saccharopolyspora montiporae TaxID=2781240 RepID=A0A929FYB2_9PSEU|nr:xanthine dehydrogenase family protein subunit M [Saccharopolyspora sp. HNM0983]
MKPAAFDYHRPSTVDESVSLLAEFGDDAKVIAGGQSLVPMLALRIAVFDHLVDLGRIPELRGIRREGGSTWVGAGTTQATIEHSADIAGAVPLLARATPLIAHVPIRNRGTLGGSLAHADAAAEYPAVALALDAELQAASVRGKRSIPAGRFFTGVWTTELADDEVLTGVRFPVWSGRTGFAVEEFARRKHDFAVAGATAAVELDDTDHVVRCAIGLFGLGPAPQRASAAEAGAIGNRITDVDAEEIGRQATTDLETVPSDLHGSSAYRKRVGAAVVARAWRRASEEAAHG